MDVDLPLPKGGRMSSLEAMLRIDPEPRDTQASEADAVARAAIKVEAAVFAARLLVAEAATTARHVRATAAQDADALTADQAAQDATATRYRTHAEATRVRKAAEAAAATVLQAEADPTGPEALRRASDMAAAVRAAAVAAAEANAALASSVASAVAMRAELVTATRRSSDRAFEADVEATAAAVQILALETAAVLGGA